MFDEVARFEKRLGEVFWTWGAVMMLKMKAASRTNVGRISSCQ